MKDKTKLFSSFFILCIVLVFLTGWSATLDARNINLEKQLIAQSDTIKVLKFKLQTLTSND